jgi:hypothetical protein
MTRPQANKLIFIPNGYNITTSGVLYRMGGRKIGICYFDWNTRQLEQVNIPSSLEGTELVKEVRALCLLHNITVKIMEHQ